MFQAKFQSFADAGGGGEAKVRLAALREAMRRLGLDGFVLPRADAQQNEYVPESEERLAFLSGFTGSAGAAIVLADRAVLFVDGRYTLQAREQADPALFEIAHLVETPPAAWLEKNLKPAMRIGYDPWLHTAESAEKLAKATAAAGAVLVPVAPNPLDEIWPDRPAPPAGRIVLHDIRFAGEAAEAKLERLRAELAPLRSDALVVSDPHNVAWLFNIRGADVAHTPLPLAYALVPREGRAVLYVEAGKLDRAVRERLQQLAEVRQPDRLAHDLAALSGKKKSIRLDAATAAQALSREIEQAGGQVVRGTDPLTAMKAVKNAAETSGARAAHRRDGAAFARFLAWFDRTAPAGQLTEIDAVAALETFRAETGLLKDISFATIAGAGPDGAIVHYRVTEKTNRRIVPGELFLIDSGAQYEDGTTDITRTLATGAATPDMRRHFTLVLKGHIAIARAVFPDGTTGAQLDTLARQFLWRHGLDFDHGTGHGVGSYLSVHEGPARISKLGSAPLKRGMILSNEPGYYRTGHYGIRIENLVLVTEIPAPAGAEKALEGFETLTLAPIDTRLVDASLLTEGETAWLDAYHARVAEILSPLVDTETRRWLAAATARIGR